MENLQVPYLKKEARITFGSIIIQELQACISLLSKDIDSTSLNEKIEQKRFSDFTTNEKVCMQLMNIVKQAYKNAEEQGMVYYSNLESTISSSLSSTSSE